MQEEWELHVETRFKEMRKHLGTYQGKPSLERAMKLITAEGYESAGGRYGDIEYTLGLSEYGPDVEVGPLQVTIKVKAWPGGTEDSSNKDTAD